MYSNFLQVFAPQCLQVWQGIDVIRTRKYVPYEEGMSLQEHMARLVQKKQLPELIWLLEHPGVYTMGRSASEKDLIQLQPPPFPVLQTNRGGKITLHNPGQRICYFLLNVQERFQGDLRRFLTFIENVGVAACAKIGVSASASRADIGIWAHRVFEDTLPQPLKIGSLGVRIQKGISLHGMALNISNDLSPYAHIRPCGLESLQITSLENLGYVLSLEDFDQYILEALSSTLTSDI